MLGVFLLSLFIVPGSSHAESNGLFEDTSVLECEGEYYFACFRVYTSCGIGKAQYCSEWGESGLGLLDWLEYLEEGLC